MSTTNPPPPVGPDAAKHTMTYKLVPSDGTAVSNPPKSIVLTGPAPEYKTYTFEQCTSDQTLEMDL
jgi:hypothetical protein